MNQPLFPRNGVLTETSPSDRLRRVERVRRSVSLSILMPVFNEERTLRAAIDRVFAVHYPCQMELIVVDDGSTDNTSHILDTLSSKDVVVVTHPVNRGKGAAVRTGLEYAAGSHLVILDADLEYLPSDIPSLLGPVLDGCADHVFGARIRGVNARFPSFRFAVGGRMTTLAANLLYDACLADMHTCLKLVPTDHLRSFSLKEGGFGLDTEVTARLLRGGIRPFEVPVTYHGRSVDEGKKITWHDGFTCLAILVRVRMQRRPEILPRAERFPVAAHTLHRRPRAVG